LLTPSRAVLAITHLSVHEPTIETVFIH